MRGNIMDVQAFEKTINKVDGIINSKIVVDGEQAIEIHILADSLRSPKQIVRDVETALLVTYDYRVDRKIVSIAQTESEDKKGLRRIRFTGISLSTYENTVECTIKLDHDGEEFCITESGIRTSSGKNLIIARSAVKAVEAIIGQTSIFDVQNVLIHNYNDVSFVSVLINMISRNGEEALIGSAIVRNNTDEAIAKAALDAVNRRL
jgi:hypothetical protein